MNAHDAIVDLPTVAIPLATDTHRIFAALGRAGLVHTTDGFGMGMVFRDDPLAAISELLFIPLDRFEKAL
jgi:hypothetical protein